MGVCHFFEIFWTGSGVFSCKHYRLFIGFGWGFQAGEQELTVKNMGFVCCVKTWFPEGLWDIKMVELSAWSMVFLLLLLLLLPLLLLFCCCCWCCCSWVCVCHEVFSQSNPSLDSWKDKGEHPSLPKPWVERFHDVVFSSIVSSFFILMEGLGSSKCTKICLDHLQPPPKKKKKIRKHFFRNKLCIQQNCRHRLATPKTTHP